jgi:hypothetical protein
MPIWNILQQIGIFYGHLVFLYIFLDFAIFCQEKSGNPVSFISGRDVAFPKSQSYDRELQRRCCKDFHTTPRVAYLHCKNKNILFCLKKTL